MDVGRRPWRWGGGHGGGEEATETMQAQPGKTPWGHDAGWGGEAMAMMAARPGPQVGQGGGRGLTRYESATRDGNMESM